jgi:endonuclease/exonuclease/phosphatase (EEP) superfamily protein YafD
MVEVRWRDSTITIVGVHLHWPLGPDASRLRNLELAKLATLANAHVGPLLIGGDFNATPWSPHFQNFVTDSRLQDCARDHALAPTWPAQVPPLAIRIDQCFASNHWRVLDVKTGPYLGSDHRPTIAALELQTAAQSTATLRK